MEKIDKLRGYGLFDAKVPRYTSYPPANHFADRIGQDNQAHWLRAVPDGSEISIYIHIPFCKRLCWFCACRTQGTKTLRPVDAYVDFLRRELAELRLELPPEVTMSRLHLGGGTPTILSVDTMSLLLGDVFKAFPKAEEFEFSVEIDPTEAAPELLSCLIDHGLNRASLGVQDFAPEVQAAIGRPQSLEQTRTVVEFLRSNGVSALNLDLLYGLPHQTAQTFETTLDAVIGLKPDRLAIYGYAHVPWMSKRQVMIHEKDLPDGETRFRLSELARSRLKKEGFEAIGIDHFATPQDGLCKAQAKGEVRRNFQGYTVDQSSILIGLGASAISKFPQGYLQNAVATKAYQDRIEQTKLAAHKGYKMTYANELLAQIIEDLLCRFSFQEDQLKVRFPEFKNTIKGIKVMLLKRFPDVFFIDQQGLGMNEWARPLVRIIASNIDSFSSSTGSHSAAI